VAYQEGRSTVKLGSSSASSGKVNEAVSYDLQK
jgi:hypothetical protein